MLTLLVKVVFHHLVLSKASFSDSRDDDWDVTIVGVANVTHNNNNTTMEMKKEDTILEIVKSNWV